MLAKHTPAANIPIRSTVATDYDAMSSPCPRRRLPVTPYTNGKRPEGQPPCRIGTRPAGQVMRTGSGGLAGTGPWRAGCGEGPGPQRWPAPKLTADQVRAARRLYDEREHTMEQIGSMFGVSRSGMFATGPHPIPLAGACPAARLLR